MLTVADAIDRQNHILQMQYHVLNHVRHASFRGLSSLSSGKSEASSLSLTCNVKQVTMFITVFHLSLVLVLILVKILFMMFCFGTIC